ncbi:DUF2336 domain-containing protein [Asticcacaulis sp.]|uniref:DUF2336 domain-containing protein n=1 Tax=Asticcacaulis sp. TaxID=1872648 RepID=UPI002BC1F51A|nr:DUF2336 domain-containing protein [Asticcacaulis sp.]HTM81212.1 DUF2336 domain-containing protein [Asticcacaulis sp.]
MSALPFAFSTESAPAETRLTVARTAEAAARDFRNAGLSLVARKPLYEVPELPVGELIRSDEELVVRLCRLPVDLAAPLLRASLPALTPQALLALVTATGEAHHRLIAARPGLDWRVIKALIRTQNDSVMAALIGNPALSFDEEDQLGFARRALENADIRAAVLAHEGLAVAKSQVRLHHGADMGHSNLKLIALVRGGEAAGFVREMARRLKLDTPGLGRVLASESAVPLALAVCAAGLDRVVFLHILSVWQGAYEAAPQMTDGQRPLVLSVFGLTAADARRRLALLIDQAH